MEAVKSIKAIVGLGLKATPLWQLCNRCYATLCRKGVDHRPVCGGTTSWRWSPRWSYSTATDADAKPSVAALKGSRLHRRSLILVKGRDSADLLQGLTTNDMELLDHDRGQKVIYTMFLNKQGRVLYDVLCYRWDKGQQDDPPSYLLECDSTVSPELQKHLKMYRIRKKVDITSLDSEFHIWSVFSSEITPPPTSSPDSHLCDSHRFSDPRVSGLGQRVILPQGSTVSGVDEVCEEDYCTHRYQWGVAEGVNELPPGDPLPLECNLAIMNGVSFSKGCYLGQELTARTHHTGVIRKRIMPVQLKGNTIPDITPGTTIKTTEGKNVGKLRCHLHENGLALLRTALIGNKLSVSVDGEPDTEIEAKRPAWWPKEIINK